MEAQELMMDAKSISLNGASNGVSKEEFCKRWPDAKSALEHLRDMVKNPVMKAVVNTVIKSGDTVAGVVCKIE
jgi:hypothetical protein